MFVLIVVLAVGGSMRPVVVTSEFISWNSCEAARQHVVEADRRVTSVISHGCYKK